MKYGFIGCGNMAGAIISGCVRRGSNISTKNIYFYEKNNELADERIKKYGIIKCESPAELVNSCDVVIFAVKPVNLTEAVLEVKQSLLIKKPIVVSIAAGIYLDSIDNMLGNGSNIPVVRAMPNMNAAVCEGMTGVCANKSIASGDLQVVLDLFNHVGKTVVIEEKLFPIYTGIAGCSPAFTYMFIDSLARAALKHGMNKQQALETAAQAVLGSAKMLMESGKHPWELIDMVCSPGGSTIEGVCSLQENKFESTIVSAVEATVTKDNIMKEAK